MTVLRRKEAFESGGRGSSGDDGGKEMLGPSMCGIEKFLCADWRLRGVYVVQGTVQDWRSQVVAAQKAANASGRTAFIVAVRGVRSDGIVCNTRGLHLKGDRPGGCYVQSKGN